MDVVQIDKTGENFRLIFDIKGRYTIHRITNQEAKYKLCRVREIKTDPRMSPTCTHPMAALFATPIPSLRPMIPSGWTSTPVKSWIPSNSRLETCAWSLEAVTLDVLEPSCTGKDILVLSILCTLRMPPVTLSLPVWDTFS